MMGQIQMKLINWLGEGGRWGEGEGGRDALKHKNLALSTKSNHP